ncbi:hypothetical protein AMJ44_03640 [candidate division WOR-1 bacterium DG_54_3]|uniref:EamA domain-containing protein n=1 Tax=candidate division WOR-1 bacterium DG_54_3 TaxID=1703775 RepID=A0A0S7Y5U9_UNCSA|nr:MAG: hypothetical protein AMJ44_03640 [candidate division WOR-1 bacterium DG_54_3]
MKNLLLWILFYTLVLAFSQILLKLGVSQVGGFIIKDSKDLFFLTLQIIKNPLIILGIILMASSFFLWIYILSWFKLGLVFPLTALVYVFVALMSYFLLGEKLSALNYFGIILIATGIFFLLYK